MRFIFLLLLTVSSLAFGQRSQTIDADCLRIKDGTCIDKLELGYLDGASSAIQVQIDSKANASDVSTSLSGKVGTTGDESVAGVKTFTGKITASSTTNGFKPCPEMTEAQRDAVVTPVSGDCVFNSTSATLNIYNGSLWKSAGGGLSDWAGSFAYALGDVVIADDKIYQCNEAHTSFDFATDLAAVKWIEISPGLTGIISLANGGTAKNITASNGAIAYSDTDSLELLAPGTSGQILQANGVAAPTFVNKSISAKAENGSSVTLEEIQVPNNQFTTTATNKHLLNDCGSSNNLLANCGFEHSTPATSWTLTSGSSTVETSDVKQGKQSLKLTLTAQALDFYQTSTLNATAFADGVQGSIFLAIKTTVDNVYLCRTDSAGAVVASTDGTKITNCPKVSNSGKWGDYPLGIILGATSNGLRLVSLTPSTAAAVAVTGDVYVDAGILEAGLKVQVANNIGPWTSYTPTFTGLGTVTTIDMKWRQNGTDIEVRGVFTVGTPTATEARISLPSSYTSATTPTLSLAGDMGRTTNASTTYFRHGILAEPLVSYVTIGHQVSAQGLMVKRNGDVIAVTGETFSVNFSIPVTQLSNASSVYTVPSDSFSTDSNTLAHKTTAIASTDPIGTYNTYSYAINTNTKTICGTAPSILPNAADGFKIFTRAYNAASTCGNPARVEIKIGAAGTKFPTIKTDIYKSAAKVTSGQMDYIYPTAAADYGLTISSYDEVSGVAIYDAGFKFSASNTSSNLVFSDNSTSATSGFLVINAQKAKDSIIGSFAEVNTSPGIAKPEIFSFTFGTTNITTICSASPCFVDQGGSSVSSMTRSTTGTYAVNLSKTYTKLKCSGTGFNPAIGEAWLRGLTCNNCNSLSILSLKYDTTVNMDSYASIVCHGVSL